MENKLCPGCLFAINETIYNFSSNGHHTFQNHCEKAFIKGQIGLECFKEYLKFIYFEYYDDIVEDKRSNKEIYNEALQATKIRLAQLTTKEEISDGK